MTDYDKLAKALREAAYVSTSWHSLMMQAADAIEALQSQLPKQGEWLIHSTGGSMATKKCPFCGSESWQSKEYAKVPKYCQNCGAHLPTFKIMDWVDYLYAKTEVQE